MMGGMMGGFGSGFGGFSGLGLIGMILNLAITVALIVGVVLLIAWLWRRLNTSGGAMADYAQPTAKENSPREILRVRYARGEITREQYQETLADLSQ